MLFKQIQLWHLTPSQTYFYDQLMQQMQQLSFQPCLPSLPFSIGWTSPVEEEGYPLVEQVNQRLLICMRVEERILPASVVRHTLNDKIKQLEMTAGRKIGKKEKDALKDEVIMTLLPRTFSKFARVYAYIDTKHHWLVLGTTQKKRTEQFLGLFKKCLNESAHASEVKNVSTILTHWLSRKNLPSAFNIEKKCLLQGVNEKARMIRCQQQSLAVNGIHEFIKDGCEVKQLALTWRDTVKFILSDDFTLRNLNFGDEMKEQVREMEAETKQQRLMADFYLQSETLSLLLGDLLPIFSKNAPQNLEAPLSASVIAST